MITDAREHVAALLTAAGVPAQPYPPATLTPPCAVLLPGSPYLTPAQLGGVTVGLEVRLVVTAAGPDAPAALDALTEAAARALAAAGVPTGPVPAPVADADAGYLSLTIPTEVPWED